MGGRRAEPGGRRTSYYSSDDGGRLEAAPCAPGTGTREQGIPLALLLAAFLIYQAQVGLGASAQDQAAPRGGEGAAVSLPLGIAKAPGPKYPAGWRP